MLAGAVKVGAAPLMVTAKLTVPVKLAASIAVQVTVVTPAVKVEPEIGTQVTAPIGVLQPLVTAGAGE